MWPKYLLKKNLRRGKAGFTLVEVLVGTVMVTIILVGIMFLLSKLFVLTALKKNLANINQLGLEGLDRMEAVVSTLGWKNVVDQYLGADKYYNVENYSLVPKETPCGSDPIYLISKPVGESNTPDYYRCGQVLMTDDMGVYAESITWEDKGIKDIIDTGDVLHVNFSSLLASTETVAANAPEFYFSCTNRSERTFGVGASITHSLNDTKSVLNITIGSADENHPLIAVGDYLKPKFSTIVNNNSLKSDATAHPGIQINQTVNRGYPSVIKLKNTINFKSEVFNFERIIAESHA